MSEKVHCDYGPCRSSLELSTFDLYQWYVLDRKGNTYGLQSGPWHFCHLHHLLKWIEERKDNKNFT